MKILSKKRLQLVRDEFSHKAVESVGNSEGTKVACCGNTTLFFNEVDESICESFCWEAS